ncbi:MAG: prepilin-type N-terminal cleavage/methylation domain-containing protein [Deltaproteobacteria bacterium]|nr:prepilin-type N-terminal cleavage/methylation domain-containing protein [Deltaproteobacteria bacterium]
MNNERGFTLIELLVVVAIIGILAAIAIPQFSRYRGNAYCARAMTDAKNAFLAMEAYYAQNLVYGSLADANFASSAGVTVAVDSTTPLVITATDDTGQCPQGSVYTLSESSGKGEWS